MIDRFQDLLSQLGKVFEMPLRPDRHNASTIEIGPIRVQMQLDPTQEKLVLFAKIIEIPPGKFRENILHECLKANGLSSPRPGIFGYVAKTNHLALYQRYPLTLLNGESLAGLFGAFYELALAWHNAIQQGRSAPFPLEKPKRP